MTSKISKFLLLLLISLLQSCSGGKIGNILESSFKNSDQINLNEIKEESKIKTQTKSLVDENNNKPLLMQKEKLKKESLLKNDPVNLSKKKRINLTNQKLINKNIVETKSIKKRKFDPQSYRIIVILREVDPTAPAQNFSNILRNSSLNFEIEKIERFPLLENNEIKN
tara:strand:- start:1087 stop:1590 length:504 start_codon:yes stop_codon:yes gene_type:complete